MEYLTNLIITYGYIALLPLAAFEGPIISLVVGFLIHLGYFEFFPAYGILILGDIIPDTAYYYIGRLGNHHNLIEKYGSKLTILKNNLPLISKLWHDHGKKTMFLSKLAYGLSTPLLVSAGLIKMPFRKFISYTIPVTLIQYGVLMAIGYFLGHSYSVAEKYVKGAGILFAVVLIIFVGLYAVFTRYINKEIKREIIEEEKEMEHIS